MLNLFKKGKDVNVIETALDKVVKSLLTEYATHKLELARLLTFGKASDASIKEVEDRIDNVLKHLIPLLEVAEQFVPKGIPFLADALQMAIEDIKIIVGQ